ncbi:MAG: hypothetical protein ACD_79C01078G0002 [uncultured bacterium]|nr:MAG: hypothetical protein ACD_79C01078G0002 [uncultured bacterium]
MLANIRDKKTSIIATVGPACRDIEVIKSLIKEGVNVFRLNFSHGDYLFHKEMLDKIRKASEDINIIVGILADLSGPKIRIGTFESGSIILNIGDKFEISIDDNIVGNQSIVSTTYKHLISDVNTGDKILLDDGNISLKAILKKEKSILCEVLDGGVLKNKKGMNLPGIKLSAPSLTEKDKKDLEFILKENIDFVALSFIRSKKCVLSLKELTKNSNIKIVSKIEKPEALNDIDAIIEISDAVMIARGDLGVEVPIEKVPVIQKQIINICASKGVPVITATQMLESMIENQRPTRAESTDVFNAIIDGTDAVMLSGETSVGKNPIDAVKVMSAIAIEAENANLIRNACNGKKNIHYDIPETTAHIACQSAYDVNAKAIVAFTESGSTVKRISKYHPHVPIIALSSSIHVLQQLSLYYGTNVYEVNDVSSTDELFKVAENIVKELGVVKGNDTFIIVAGLPLKVKGVTNLIKIHQLSE